MASHMKYTLISNQAIKLDKHQLQQHQNSEHQWFVLLFSCLLTELNKSVDSLHSNIHQEAKTRSIPLSILQADLETRNFMLMPFTIAA